MKTENENLKTEKLSKNEKAKIENPEEIANPEQSESEKLSIIEWRIEQFAKKHGFQFERNMNKETFEHEGEKIEIDLLITQHKMRAQRKRKTRHLLKNAAIFAFIFTLLRIYFEVSILVGFLQTIIIQLAIGLIVMIVKYMKFRKQWKSRL